MIEISNESQRIKIQNITALLTYKVKVEQHTNLNSSIGTIRYRNLPQHSERKIQEELESYKVTNVKRVSHNQEQSMSGIYLLTFDCCHLPTSVKIGWTSLSVREYMPTPRRCFQCQQWGHGAKTGQGDSCLYEMWRHFSWEGMCDATKCSNCK